MNIYEPGISVEQDSCPQGAYIPQDTENEQVVYGHTTLRPG